ncbi:MAG TPA: polysaccharide deacetylase family protein [Cyclobacteriaceae bacterium]|nr:polysaccharide deacetylase family protein [Cyclobacteriaceae bacterium]
MSLLKHSTYYFWLLVAGFWLPVAGYTQLTVDKYGAIVRGDTSRKEISLVFTGDEFGEGGDLIRKTLSAHNIKGSFFLTGNFYSDEKFNSLIRLLKKDGHYLGAHSDKHLLYAPWDKRDSLLVTKQQFESDLQNNYQRMNKFGVKKEDALWFLPPFEWYNSEIVHWTSALGFRLVNFTPGTRSTADYTYPEMGKSYRSSEEIYQSIIQYEKNDPKGLNGFILLIHVGTDPRRTDKFYFRLNDLLNELKKKGYRFERIDALLR